MVAVRGSSISMGQHGLTSMHSRLPVHKLVLPGLVEQDYQLSLMHWKIILKFGRGVQILSDSSKSMSPLPRSGFYARAASCFSCVRWKSSRTFEKNLNCGRVNRVSVRRDENFRRKD
jgi:hypothetical protein